MMIDEYTMLKCIGKGAFGEVYLTSKAGTNQLFATKKVSKQKADSPAIKKYFINELTILKEIKHKNIVHFETIKHTIHNYYIITEFCNGGGLSDCLKKYMTLYGRAFPEEIVQHLMRQIVEALKYLHGIRIIHRDIKLDNILVNFESEVDKNSLNMMKAQVKLIDFGFATHLGAANVRYSTLGSPINMDPILLKKLTSKNGTANLIGYDEKADIWSLGTVCYEMLIGKGVFNAETMVDLIKKVEYGNYHVPTNLSKEVVSFLNGMLQYSAKNRLSAEELSRHYFLTKNIKDFKRIDLTKVCHKLDNQGLNINIKRNQSIWAIFKEEDEKTLIDIPGKYLIGISPISEQDEYSQRNQPKSENPFKKANDINVNNNINNNITNNNQINKPKEKTIDYNLLQQQQKLYHQINLKNNNFNRYANYAYNNTYANGTANNYVYNNYYVNGQPKYYTAYLNGKKNININTNTKINSQTTVPIQTIPTVNNVVAQVPQNNQLLLNQQYQQNIITQYPQYKYIIANQPQYTETNALPSQNVQVPVTNQNQIVSQKYIQPTTQLSAKSYQNQNILVQQPIIIPSDNNKNEKNKKVLNTSKISAISSATTKTVTVPGSRFPKYDNYMTYETKDYKMIDLENYQKTNTNNQQKIQAPIKQEDQIYQKPQDGKKVSNQQNLFNEQPKTQIIQPQTYNQQNQLYEQPKTKIMQPQINKEHNQAYEQQQFNQEKPEIYYQQPQIYSQYQTKSEQKIQPQIQYIQQQSQPNLEEKYNEYEKKAKYKENSTKPNSKKSNFSSSSKNVKYQANTYNTYSNKYNSQKDLVKYDEPKNNFKNYTNIDINNDLQDEYVHNHKKQFIELNNNINNVKIAKIPENKNKEKYEYDYPYQQKKYKQNIEIRKIENNQFEKQQPKSNHKNYIPVEPENNNENKEIFNEPFPMPDSEESSPKKEESKNREYIGKKENRKNNILEDKSKRKKMNNYDYPQENKINNKYYEYSDEKEVNIDNKYDGFPIQRERSGNEFNDKDNNNNYYKCNENIREVKYTNNNREYSKENEYKNNNESPEEKEDSKKDDDNSSEELEDLIDFKLGDELCPEPEEEKYNDDEDDNIDLPMKKIMERTVERPTIGVPPPGTDINDNFCDDDDYDNGIFQTNTKKENDNDDYY